jgi:hypothetical protein
MKPNTPDTEMAIDLINRRLDQAKDIVALHTSTEDGGMHYRSATHLCEELLKEVRELVNTHWRISGATHRCGCRAEAGVR